MALNEEAIEQRLDLVKAGAIVVSDQLGGVILKNASELFEFAKMMAISKQAVPAHCRSEPGVCLAVCIQALEWRMSPFSVANQSYMVKDRIAYQAQLIHAVVLARAKLKGAPRATFTGEGPTLRITVSAHLEGETEPLIYESPEVQKITVKNSPLWASDPEQQLWYYGTRAWARRYVPHVLLGIYSDEELRDAEIGPEHARDVTPKPDVATRLRAVGEQQGGAGFQRDNVDRALAHQPDTPMPDLSGAGKPELEKVAVAEPQRGKPRAARAKPAQDAPAPAEPETAAPPAEADKPFDPVRDHPAFLKRAVEAPDAEELAEKAMKDAEDRLTRYTATIEECADLGDFRTQGLALIQSFEGIDEDQRGMLAGHLSHAVLAAKTTRAKKKTGKG